ncbi:MAG: hypothetical protein HY841_14435 [Bacteroidetes bacterium]|nr:hypothetical protein [Bacteroidota bacterium]
MTKQQIIKSIESHIRRKSFLKYFWGYENWYIGVTKTPNKRKQAHRHPEKWRAWKTSNAVIARAIEKYFLAKKMKGGGGGGTNTIWVYVY